MCLCDSGERVVGSIRLSVSRDTLQSGIRYIYRSSDQPNSVKPLKKTGQTWAGAGQMTVLSYRTMYTILLLESSSGNIASYYSKKQSSDVVRCSLAKFSEV